MKNKLNATGPEGLFATRETDRTYTNVVWIRKTEAIWRRELESSAKHQRAEARKYRQDLEVDNGGPLMHRWGREQVEKWAESADKSAAAYEAKLEAGFSADWRCEHWCGRLDLAIKQQSKWNSDGWETFLGDVLPNVEKGSRWIGQGGYYSGEVIVDRVKSVSGTTWIRFDLEGHGEEEISIVEFLKYFKPAAEPAFVVEH